MGILTACLLLGANLFKRRHLAAPKHLVLVWGGGGGRKSNVHEKPKKILAHLQGHSAMADGPPCAFVIAELFHLGNPFLALLQHFVALHPEVVMDNLQLRKTHEQPCHMLQTATHCHSKTSGAENNGGMRYVLITRNFA